MLSGILVAVGVVILIFGPFPPLFPYFNQVLGIGLIVGGPLVVHLNEAPSITPLPAPAP